jgi:serine protease AprX
MVGIMPKIKFIFFILMLFPKIHWGQGKYLVYFKDKSQTNYSINQPDKFLSVRSIARRQKQNITIKERDLPVSENYIDSLKKYQCSVWYKSKWLNAAYIYINDTNIVQQTLLKKTFIKKIDFLKPEAEVISDNSVSSSKKRKAERIQINHSDYGSSLNQINMICADEMHNNGFHGEGIQIAIMDGGFYRANTLPFLDSLYRSNSVLGTYDFVDRRTDVYSITSDHGTSVLSCLAAYAKGSMIGTAYKAQYYLFRTEDVATEYPIEEANWLIAAEKADSLGVDIISTSLGYKDFDLSWLNHPYSDFDGKTTIISKAANAAASVGMLCVVSAGNDGNSKNKYIAPPSDSDSVLTVGAVDNQGNIASFSSYGPTFDGRIKPDVVALGVGSAIGTSNGNVTFGNGTSFATPILCGMVAGLWQAFPFLTNLEIMEHVKKSGSRVQNPDFRYGYGIPCFKKILMLVNGKNNLVLCDEHIFPNPFTNQTLNLLTDISERGKRLVVEVLDISGKIVFIQTIEDAQQSNKLDISGNNLSAGLYFVKITGKDFSKIIRLLKI